MKKILLTGGGTAGHVTPNIALLPHLIRDGFEIEYVGSYSGIEKSLIENEGILYHGISTGKLRRYFSLKNLTDPFRVSKGYFQAKRIVKTFKPDIVFSKGGFVSVPVVRAARRYHVPVIIHESDITPGLANKMCYSSAEKICCNFPDTLKYIPEKKGICTGSPIREELFYGEKRVGCKICGFTTDMPVCMVIGGSLGSRSVNRVLRQILPELTERFQVIHICGKGNVDPRIKNERYVQFEFVSDELKDLLAASDLVISRAGANSIYELLALKKPNILIPLPESVSRGDQVLNARAFKKQGFSYLIEEIQLNKQSLLSAIHDVYDDREIYIKTMSQAKTANGVNTIMELIEQYSYISKKDGKERNG